MNQCQPFESWPEILSPADVIRYLGISHQEAYMLFNRSDFPLINREVHRGKKIGKYALRDYLNQGTVAER